MPLHGQKFVTANAIPHLHRLFIRHASQTLAVWAEDGFSTRVLDDKKLLAGMRIPHFYCFVFSMSCHTFAVRAKLRDVLSPLCTATFLDAEEFLARLRIRHLHFRIDVGLLRIIPGALGIKNHALAIWAEAHAERAPVSANGASLLNDGCIPDLDGPIAATRGESLSVRTEHYIGDRARVPLESKELITGLGIAHLNYC